MNSLVADAAGLPWPWVSLLVAFALACAASSADGPSAPRPRRPGESVFETCPPDARGIVLKRPAFPVHGDGKGDDAPAIQEAIDLARKGGLETQHGRIVFVPEGTYRLGRTVHVWRGVRLIGFGRRRPVLRLGDSTPGFQGDGPACLIHFCNAPGRPGQPPRDASNVTFFAGISNINIEIGTGNPAAAAVRSRTAQHCYLRHVDFRLGSAMAGIHEAGNEIEDCRFFGGRWAVRTGGTSASWQFLVLDCHFEGQQVAGIESRDVGLTAIRCRFKDMPVGCRVPPGAGIERLYLADSRFENVSRAAIATAEKDDPVNQVNVQNTACAATPVFLTFRGTGPALRAPGETYLVADLSHGLHVVEPFGAEPEAKVRTTSRIEPLAKLPDPPPADYPQLPPVAAWVDARTLGVVGDGKADDTAALRKAVAQHKVLYLPAGKYRLTDTLTLGAETMLIGLHPHQTKFSLDADAPGFGDPAAPKPLLEAPKGGRCFVTGVGFRALAAGAIAVKWLAGERSCMDDVWMDWGKRRGPQQAHSLWITDGGGGTFKNIWSADYLAASGLFVSRTETPGRVYLMSVEHHRQVEVVLKDVANWSFYALQTEENLNSPDALAVDIINCRALRFLNLFTYRVIAQKKGHPHAVRLAAARDIRFRGIHNYSFGDHPFDHPLFDADSGRYLKAHEVARLTAKAPPPD